MGKVLEIKERRLCEFWPSRLVHSKRTLEIKHHPLMSPVVDEIEGKKNQDSPQRTFPHRKLTISTFSLYSDPILRMGSWSTPPVVYCTQHNGFSQPDRIIV